MIVFIEQISLKFNEEEKKVLDKNDAKMAQGLEIIGMVALHLFCRIDNLPYSVTK